MSEPRPVVSAAPVASASVGPMRAEIGALAPALTTSPATDDLGVATRAVRYGRGVMTFSSWGDPTEERSQPCPLRLAARVPCAVYAVSTTGQAPAEDDWHGRPEPPGATTSVLRQDPLEWTILSPGRDAVYAFGSTADPMISRIDERGNRTTWLERSKGQRSFEAAAVLEVGARRFLLVSDVLTGLLAPVNEGKPGDKVTLGAWVPMPMAQLDPLGGTASDVRVVTGTTSERDPWRRKGPMAMLAVPTAVELRAPGEWALVWIEGIAPPHLWPQGKAWKSPRRGRHSCGRPSRSVTDVGVDKLIHLTRMRDTKVVSDVVLRADNTLDPSRLLQVRVVDQGVEVEGVTYSLDGKKLSGQLAPADQELGQWMPKARREYPLSLSFDRVSGQGLLLVQGGEAQWARAFDARGSFVGEAIQVRTAPSSDEERASWQDVAASDGHWTLLDSREERLMFLPGSTVVEVPGELAHGELLTVGGKVRLVKVSQDSLSEAFVDPVGHTIGATVTRPLRGLAQPPLELKPLDDEPSPTWVALQRREDAWELWRLRPGESSWEQMAAPSPGAAHPSIHLMMSGAGLVAGIGDGKTTHLRWLRTGQEHEAGLPAVTSLPTPPWFEGPFQVLGEKDLWGIVPSEPGPLVRGSLDSDARGGCAASVATGPTTVVLACQETIGPLRPGFHAGLRLVTLTR